MSRLAAALVGILLASSAQAETHPVEDASGRLLGSVQMESLVLDRVLAVPNPATASAAVVVAHGRKGGATLYRVAEGAAVELLATNADESLTAPVWSPDGTRLALAKVLPPTWIPGDEPQLQSHGALLLWDGRGEPRRIAAGDDIGRVLGWLDARTLVLARLLPGDLPEERPWALDLKTGALRPLFGDSGHLYGLELLGGQLFFARTPDRIVTLPGASQSAELVQRDPASGAERILVREPGALPVPKSLEGSRLTFADDGTLVEHTIDLQTGETTTTSTPAALPTPRPAPSPGGVLAMPYIHQVYDTPDDFSGGWACGPTSTLMCILHYGRLQPWPITASTPYSHQSDYGAYDAYQYTAYGSTFNRMQTDASGRAAHGAYGWCTDGGAAWAYRMQDYAQRHNLSSDFNGSSSFGAVQAAIDAGQTVALSTRLTSAGHIIAIKGYTSDGHLVANDPYGDKNQGYMNYKGEGALYTWAQVNSAWLITVYGTVVPTNHPPIGYIDGAGCDQVAGWSQDPDEPDKAIDVHLYFNGPAGSGAPGVPVNAGENRPDLCKAIGSCNHGYRLRSPLSLFDGAGHEVHAYGIDSQGGPNPELGASPKTLQCASTPPAGVKRHVTNPDVLGAWKFDFFMDLMPTPVAQVDAIASDIDIPPTPVMIRADGDPAVYLVDNGYRRHVPDPEVASSWRLDLGAVQVKPPAEVSVLPETIPLRRRPVLVIGSGSAVYVIDDVLPGPDAAAPGPDAAMPVADAGPLAHRDASHAQVPDAAPEESVDVGSVQADGGAILQSDSGHHPDGAAGYSEAKAGCGCGASAGASPMALGMALLVLCRRRAGRA